MKTYSSILIVAALALLAGGCASAPPAAKSGIELQAYQAREFETSKRTAFSWEPPSKFSPKNSPGGGRPSLARA
jgi:PBP1b-binding outer membrane lipoprotein LpoB